LGAAAPIGSKGANLLLFRPPGGGKSHLAAALGLALVENGWRVLFKRNSDLVQRLQIARRELALESALAKLDKYRLLILDDIVRSTRIKPKLLAKESEKQACRTMVGLLALAHDPGRAKALGKGSTGENLLTHIGRALVITPPRPLGVIWRCRDFAGDAAPHARIAARRGVTPMMLMTRVRL
jgi:hypothetical protein